MLVTALTLGLLSFCLAAFLFWRIQLLYRRFNTALTTNDANNLEATLNKYFKRIESVDTKLNDLTAEYKKLSTMTGLASQKIAVVRFNPFGDTGGDQSFALAVLDSHDSGYVLTSIHGREGTRVYVKPIDYTKSKYTLSNEEQQAITLAIQRVPEK